MKSRFKEGLRVRFHNEFFGVLGAYDEGWYIKTNEHPAAWSWDCRLPSTILNRGDLCYWVDEMYIKPLTSKLGNEF